MSRFDLKHKPPKVWVLATVTQIGFSMQISFSNQKVSVRKSALSEDKQDYVFKAFIKPTSWKIIITLLVSVHHKMKAHREHTPATAGKQSTFVGTSHPQSAPLSSEHRALFDSIFAC